MLRPLDQAATAGLSPLTINQTVGTGLHGCVLMRWRMMPDIGRPGAFRIALALGLSFLAVAGFLAAVLRTASGGTSGRLGVGWGGVAAVTVFQAPNIRRPRIACFAVTSIGWPLVVPTAKLVAIGVTGAARLALLVLPPVRADPGLRALVAAFVTAVLAGPVSRTLRGLARLSRCF